MDNLKKENLELKKSLEISKKHLSELELLTTAIRPNRPVSCFQQKDEPKCEILTIVVVGASGYIS